MTSPVPGALPRCPKARCPGPFCETSHGRGHFSRGGLAMASADEILPLDFEADDVQPSLPNVTTEGIAGVTVTVSHLIGDVTLNVLAGDDLPTVPTMPDVTATIEATIGTTAQFPGEVVG